MENSKPLATESFSYSWLTHKTPSPSSSNIQMKLINLPKNNDHSFDFDVPITSSPSYLVHADEIFRDGHIMPGYDRGVYDRNSSSSRNSLSVTAYSPVLSYYSSRNNVMASDAKKSQPGSKWRKARARILQKCSGFANLLRRSMGCSNKNLSNRVDDLERRVCEVRRWSYSIEMSPRASSVEASSQVKSPARSSNVSCDVESSIDEAILYCKRSIGQ